MAIVSERWGEGLGTELAQALVNIAFGDLKLTGLVAVTPPSPARAVSPTPLLGCVKQNRRPL